MSKGKFSLSPPPTHTHPYMVCRKYGEPQYYKTFTVAKERIIQDLEGLNAEFRKLKAIDATDAIHGLILRANELPLAGGKIDGVVDPFTGTRYRVELVRRQGV